MYYRVRPVAAQGVWVISDTSVLAIGQITVRVASCGSACRCSDRGTQPCHRSHCRSASPDGVPAGIRAAFSTAPGPSTNRLAPQWHTTQSPAWVVAARNCPPGPRNDRGRPSSGISRSRALTTAATVQSNGIAANCRQLGLLIAAFGRGCTLLQTPAQPQERQAGPGRTAACRVSALRSSADRPCRTAHPAAVAAALATGQLGMDISVCAAALDAADRLPRSADPFSSSTDRFPADRQQHILHLVGGELIAGVSHRPAPHGRLRW